MTYSARLGDQPLHLHPDRGGRDMPPQHGHQNVPAPVEELIVRTERPGQQLGDGSQVVARRLLSVALFDGVQNREPEQRDIALSVRSHQRQKVRSGLRGSGQACGTLKVLPSIEIHGFPVRLRAPHFLRVLHQLSLRCLAAILSHSGVDRGDQHIALAGLGEELQDPSLVHRVHSRLHVGVAGQQHPHRFRRPLPHLGEELRAVHARHPHIRYDDGERAPLLEDGEPLRAADRGETSNCRCRILWYPSSADDSSSTHRIFSFPNAASPEPAHRVRSRLDQPGATRPRASPTRGDARGVDSSRTGSWYGYRRTQRKHEPRS